MNRKDNKRKFIYHVTTTTGHARKSYRDEIPDDTIEILKPWVRDMLNGQLRGIFDTKYTCRAGTKSSKLCEYIISRTDDYFSHTDIIKFVVCSHSSRKTVAWSLVNGQGEAPNVPFCAVQLFVDNVQPDELQHIALFADFERCISWAWIEEIRQKEE